MMDLTPIGLAVHGLVVIALVTGIERYTGERISKRAFYAAFFGGFVVSVPIALLLFAYANSLAA